MREHIGRVSEIQFSQAGAAAQILCPPEACPRVGQYLLAWAVEDAAAPLAVPLFPAAYGEDGFLAAPPTPRTWEPGSTLLLRGPLGRGFHPPGDVRRLALAALGETAARLLPLVTEALRENQEVALFADCPLPQLPVAVEVSPLSGLPGALDWADFLALDLPAARLPDLRKTLGLPHGGASPCPAQALILTGMPCGGMAECGACALPARKGTRLACIHGPVLDLSDLEL